MTRTLILTLALLALPGLASAESVQQSILAQLGQQGFATVTVSQTLLGRTRIVATSADYYREIVINPATGEILRDYWRALDGSAAGMPILIDPSSGGSANASSSGSGSGSSSGSGSNSGSDDGHDNGDGHDSGNDDDDHEGTDD